MNNTTSSKVIAADQRAAHYLIPPADDAGQRAEASVKADELLMAAGRELMRAGREDLVKRVHELLRDLDTSKS